MLTSKQRAQLRGLASTEDTILVIGKGGISPAVASAAGDALQARELIKGRVLENSLLSARSAAEELAELCHGEVVQVIGSRFVLYRRNEREPRLQLTGGKKKAPGPQKQGQPRKPEPVGAIRGKRAGGTAPGPRKQGQLRKSESVGIIRGKQAAGTVPGLRKQGQSPKRESAAAIRGKRTGGMAPGPRKRGRL